ncbi:pseudouridine synthase [Paraburkholderia bonniea]|uniref:pseudouridine synthase n=1 Tax=Paraburkholderia bonniea TaxID=2152891 RepID=UPI001291F1FF|nr:pseudouridine synthase [Paraburkholderia bonniea]
MRAKLTAKHPRPASSQRAPVRTGSTAGRKPARPATPPSGGAAPASGAPRRTPSGAPRTGASSAGGAGQRPTSRAPGGGGYSAGERRSSAPDRGAPRTQTRPARAEGAPTRERSNASAGARAPRSFADQRPRRDGGPDGPRRNETERGYGERGRAPREAGARRPYGETASGSDERRVRSGPRTPSGTGTFARGERPARPARYDETRSRFGNERNPAATPGEERRARPSSERGERTFARPVKSTYAERGERGSSFNSAPRRSGDATERPARFERGERTDRGERGSSFNSAPRRSGDATERPARFERGERTDRGERGSSFNSAPRRSSDATERPARFERGERTDRGTGTRAPRPGDRNDRSASAPRFGGEVRPSRSDSSARPPHRASANARSERPAHSNRPERSSEPRHETAPHALREFSDTPGMLRLSKLMSELGLCSRREADEWIENGWVLVDGERIDTLGIRVRPDQRIEIDPAAQAMQQKQVTILVHKTVGYVSGQAEDGYQPAVTLVTPENRWEGDPSGIAFSITHLRTLAPAGRLDIDSTGLLVLTQDGRVAKRLVGGHSLVDKEYLVRVTYGDIATDVEQHFPAASLALLCHGLELDEVPLKPASVTWQNGEQLRFVLREGKKRQIRRMCELVGLHVVGLKRVRIGQVSLGALPPGQWRYLAADEAF